MTPIALPATVVRALCDPLPDAADFTATKFQPASNKAWFTAHYLRFMSSDCPKHQFTLRFYRQLIHCFGYTACYDQDGFWTEFFSTTPGKIEFLEQGLAWPCYGQSNVTWADAEREIIRRLKRANLLDVYRQRLSTEQDAADQAELARLLAKYGPDTPAPDPGVLRTVLVPVNRPATRRTPRLRDDSGQLALGLG